MFASFGCFQSDLMNNDYRMNSNEGHGGMTLCRTRISQALILCFRVAHQLKSLKINTNINK